MTPRSCRSSAQRRLPTRISTPGRPSLFSNERVISIRATAIRPWRFSRGRLQRLTGPKPRWVSQPAWPPSAPRSSRCSRPAIECAEYDMHDQVSAGGGDITEGEDIEVIEILLADALQMI